MPAETLSDENKALIRAMIEPIRNTSVIRRISNVQTVIEPTQDNIDVDTYVDDFNITMDFDVGQSKRSNQFVTRANKLVAMIMGKLQYTYDKYQQIQRSGSPITKKLMALATHMADHEDAFSLAASFSGPRSGDHEPFIANGTSTAFDLTSYATLKSSMATYVATGTNTFNSLKPYQLFFVYNNKFMETADGLSNSTSDRSGLEYIDAVLARVGAPGSQSIHSPRLGCAITSSQDAVTIANEPDEACALFIKSDDNYSIYASRYDPRMRTFDKDQGYKNTIVERWLGQVHRAGSILYDLDATP